MMVCQKITLQHNTFCLHIYQFQAILPASTICRKTNFLYIWKPRFVLLICYWVRYTETFTCETQASLHRNSVHRVTWRIFRWTMKCNLVARFGPRACFRQTSVLWQRHLSELFMLCSDASTAHVMRWEGDHEWWQGFERRRLWPT
jgi:hypothetical protein